jgi:myosin-5
MLIRHLDHINDDKNVRSLIQTGISHIKKTIKKRGQSDLELKTLWLANTLRLLHCLKQYSGEPQFQGESTPQQIEHCLRNFDLSAYRRVLSDIAVWIYQGIAKVMEEEVQPGLVVALLEHEGIGGLSGDKPRPMRGRAGSTGTDLDTPSHLDPKEALDALLQQLTKFHLVLQKHGLDPEIISQIFRQMFYFLCAGSLNNLLLRKDMCHWSRGMQIRYNVAQLEQWARDQKIEDTGSKVIDTLLPIIQATQLLQARKSEEDVIGICDMCDKLRVSQIIKILNLYTPAGCTQGPNLKIA